MDDKLVVKKLDPSAENKMKISDFIYEIKDIFPNTFGNKENPVNIEDYITKIFTYGVCICAEVGGVVTGICMGYMNDYETKKAYITLIGVNPNTQSRGLGTKLMECMKLESRNAGMKYIRASPHHQNTGAIKFYAKNGFIPTEHDFKSASTEYLDARLPLICHL